MLMSGSYGPFRVHFPTSVPLWLGLLLKQSKACSIRPPPYLTVENLSTVLEHEKVNDTYHILPYYYFELAEAILECCPEDFGGAHDNIGRLLGEIKMIRWGKVLRDIDIFRTQGLRCLGMKITNLCCTELRRLNPIMLGVFDDGARIEALAAPRPRHHQSGEGVPRIESSYRPPPSSLDGDVTHDQLTTGTSSVTGGEITATTPSYGNVTSTTSESKRRRTLRDM